MMISKLNQLPNPQVTNQLHNLQPIKRASSLKKDPYKK